MKNLTIAVVGKDVGVANAYSSVEKALRQAASFKQLNINIEWIDSHRLNENNVADILKGYNGILVPGGFNSNGVEGIILAINYARINKDMPNFFKEIDNYLKLHNIPPIKWFEEY